jgi:putative addiction module CopG family antidote
MKFSINLPAAEMNFLDKCVETGRYPSRSAVVLDALRLLRRADLGAVYADAFTEWDKSKEGINWNAVDAAIELS